MPTNKPPIYVCMTLEQHLCCQYGRDTSCARGSAHVLCMAGGALGAALTVWVQPWAHLPILFTPTSSQVSPSLEKVLCPALSSWCLCKNPLPSACGRPAIQIPPWMWVSRLCHAHFGYVLHSTAFFSHLLHSQFWPAATEKIDPGFPQLTQAFLFWDAQLTEPQTPRPLRRVASTKKGKTMQSASSREFPLLFHSRPALEHASGASLRGNRRRPQVKNRSSANGYKKQKNFKAAECCRWWRLAKLPALVLLQKS